MKIPDRLFGRFVIGAVALGFLALVAAVGAVAFVIAELQDETRLVNHTYRVELALSEFTQFNERSEAARRGYLVQEDDRFVNSFRLASERVPGILDRLATLTADNPEQSARVDALRALSQRQLDLQNRSLEAQRSGGGDAARALFAADGSADLLDEVRALTAQMSAEEGRLLGERTGALQSSVFAAYLILGAAGVLLLLLAAGTIWAIGRNTRELTQSRNSLRSLNEDLEAAVRVRTADLQRANDEIQRFAYIVSHDLRSPLVNVMGFTSELDAATGPLSDLIDRVEAEAPTIVTEEARLAVRQDLPEAIGFIRSSTQKMDRLINAILRLSREGRRVITAERLAMAAMLGGIKDSMQHRLDLIGAEVRVEEPMPDVVSDRVALEQIFSNLVENAVKYLKPGRPGVVTVRGRRLRDRVVFEVEDNGRGIDPKDHERVFDLFRRSGTQDQPGEGIGLAHVRALAYRLGGVVSCESELDRGATFRLSMPANFIAPKES